MRSIKCVENGLSKVGTVMRLIESLSQSHHSTNHPSTLLPLLPQPASSFNLISLIKNPHNTHARILTNLLPVLADQHRTRHALLIRVARVLQVTDEAEVHRSSSEPLQRESRRRSPVELVAESRHWERWVGWRGHESL
jgi:hypothetical protein